MESRKRPFPDTEDTVVTKKRILTGTNGSPLANGSVESDENEGFRDRLEVLSSCLPSNDIHIYLLNI
jgi:E3 ubiquitin-protein ligase BRE1